MIHSTLFNFFTSAYLVSLRDKIEKQLDEEDFFEEEERNLCKTLNKKQLELLRFYKLSMENKMDALHHDLEVHSLYLGIKIGMELCEVFLDKN